MTTKEELEAENTLLRRQIEAMRQTRIRNSYPIEQTWWRVAVVLNGVTYAESVCKTYETAERNAAGRRAAGCEAWVEQATVKWSKSVV